MGDRATLQVVEVFKHSAGETEVHGPVVYAHWLGHDLPEILPGITPKMRKQDVSYATAYLVAGLIHHSGNNGLGIGVYNHTEGQTPKGIRARFGSWRHVEIRPSEGVVKFHDMHPAYYENPEDDNAEPKDQPDLQCTFMDG